MRIAVTGATGFIGRHVVAELEQRSISPVLICRPSTRKPASFSGHAIASIDLKDAPTASYDQIGRPDVLIHLAWGGLPNFMSLHHFEEELPSQYRFLKLIVELGLPKLLVVGTCFEYGKQSGPLREDMVTRPETPYGFAKDALRRQLEYLQHVRPFNLTWARPFYLYGEGQPESSLLSQLRIAVERGDSVFNMSGGEQLRDYFPVSSLAKELVFLALTPQSHGIVNICSGRPVSVRRLVENHIAENDWHIDLNLGYYPYPSHEPMAFWGDRKKLDNWIEPHD